MHLCLFYEVICVDAWRISFMIGMVFKILMGILGCILRFVGTRRRTPWGPGVWVDFKDSKYIEKADATPPHLEVFLRLGGSLRVHGSLQFFAFGLFSLFPTFC